MTSCYCSSCGCSGGDHTTTCPLMTGHGVFTEGSFTISNVPSNILRLEARQDAHRLLDEAMDMTAQGESWLPVLVRLVLQEK
jgi:hypothetical protein